MSQCLDRGVKEGEAVTTNWVLDVGEANPLAYHAYLFEEGDPAKRYGFFTVPLLVTTGQGDASALVGGGGESTIESIADSGDEQSSASGEAETPLAESAGMTVLLLLLSGALAGTLVYMIRYVIRLRMGFKE